MKKSFEFAKRFAAINFGILLFALGTYFFKTPNGFATGGISGLSIILAKALPIMSQATYMLIINSVLLVLGAIVLGRACGALTFYCSLMISLENLALEWIYSIAEPLTSHPLLELVYAILLTGIGAAILFKCNASSGGTDIVALILKKYTSLNIGQALLIADVLIATSTIFVYGIEAGLFALLGLFAKIFVIDDILDSMNMCKSFLIVTEYADEITKFITEKMKRSATVYDVKGAYTSKDKTAIMTVCKRSEAIILRKAVNSIDASAFMVITKTSEIMGKGFRDNVL